MANIRTFQISGGICWDPEFKTVGENKLSLLKFSVINKDEKDTSYFEVNMWGDKAKNAYPHLEKGTQVLLTGKLRENRWKKDDEDKWNSKVILVADTIDILPKEFKQDQCSQEEEEAASTGAV